MPSGRCYINSLNRLISILVSGEVLLLLCFIVIPVQNANSVYPDQTPRFAASDLGLHCLPMALFWDASINGLTHCILETPKRVIGK